jgi:hypothetical protein
MLYSVTAACASRWYLAKSTTRARLMDWHLLIETFRNICTEVSFRENRNYIEAYNIIHILITFQ